MRRVYGVILPLMGALLLGLFTTGARAAELTLDDCIELALQNRASIIRARSAEQLEAAGKRAALGAFLPRIGAGYSYSKGKETDIEPASYRYTGYESFIVEDTIGGTIVQDIGYMPTDSALSPNEQDIGPSKSWSLSGDLTFSVANIFNYMAAKSSHARSKLDVIASEQDLIYSVKTSYYLYLAAVENLTVEQEAVKRAEEQLKLIQSRYDLGSASLSDVLKQKVQYGNDKLGLLRARNSVTNTKASLAYTIGLDPRQDHQFVTQYVVREYEGTLDDAVSFGMTHNPSLLATEKSLAAAGSSVSAALAGYLPTASLSASYSKFNGTQAYPVAFDYSSKTKRFGFSFSWNIFDGFYREQRVTSAKVSRNNARADLADMRNYTVSTVKTAYLEIGQFEEQQSVSRENVAAADEDLKITQEKYNLGAATILDLLDAQVSLKRAQVALIQADFDLNLAITKLENAMGKM